MPSFTQGTFVSFDASRRQMLFSIRCESQGGLDVEEGNTFSLEGIENIKKCGIMVGSGGYVVLFLCCQNSGKAGNRTVRSRGGKCA